MISKKMMDDFPRSFHVSKMAQRIPLQTWGYQYCLKAAQIDRILWLSHKEHKCCTSVNTVSLSVKNKEYLPSFSKTDYT